MLITIVLVVVIVTAVALAFVVWPRRARRAAVPVAAVPPPTFAVRHLSPQRPQAGEAEEIPLGLELEPDLPLPPPPPRAAPPPEWPLRIDPKSAVLDEDSRLRLLTDLGVVRTAWCVPILAQAYDEETAPALRRAALTALASCRQPAAAETLERARYASDPEERVIASRGLAELNGAAGTPSAP